MHLLYLIFVYVYTFNDSILFISLLRGLQAACMGFLVTELVRLHINVLKLHNCIDTICCGLKIVCSFSVSPLYNKRIVDFITALPW